MFVFISWNNCFSNLFLFFVACLCFDYELSKLRVMDMVVCTE